jgi:hypothetical protein
MSRERSKYIHGDGKTNECFESQNRRWREEFKKSLDMIQKEENKYFSFVNVGVWSDNNNLYSTKNKHRSNESSRTRYDIKFIEKCKQWKELFKNRIIESEPGQFHFKEFPDATDNFRCISLRGSCCRICSKRGFFGIGKKYVSNGSLEIYYNGYRFLEGLMHYIVDHNLEISNPGFIKMIIDSPLPVMIRRTFDMNQ